MIRIGRVEKNKWRNISRAFERTISSVIAHNVHSMLSIENCLSISPPFSQKIPCFIALVETWLDFFLTLSSITYCMLYYIIARDKTYLANLKVYICSKGSKKYGSRLQKKSTVTRILPIELLGMVDFNFSNISCCCRIASNLLEQRLINLFTLDYLREQVVWIPIFKRKNILTSVF